MNVFLVDAGKLFPLDQSVISKRVQDLQVILSDLADIPLDKQVLLTHDGRALDASQQLYHYITSFSLDQPVFLFSKSNIECHIVQPHVALPQDYNLQERLEKYLKDSQTCETLKFGADLAKDYHKYSENILSRTRQLVQDQELQRAGWAAVINNLDQVTVGFEKRVAIFHDLYETFLKNRDDYSTMLTQFDEDVKVLSQIPLTKGIVDQMKDTKMIDSIRCSKEHGLGITESMRAPDPESMRAPDPGHSPLDLQQSPNIHTLDSKKSEFISLLHWIEAQDSQNSLNSLVLQCGRAMDQINLSFLPRVQEEVDKVKQSLQAPGMRDIKGLEERLQQLKNLLGQTERICEEQANNANTISNQQESFMVQGDISVLADLLVAHREQLKRLHSNNRSLVEFYNKFAAAKAELSQNLLIRLNWVTHCQKAIWNCDGRLTMISENLVRVKRRFAILEQINVAPILYCKCLGEVSRRSSFTSRYKSWGRDLIERTGRRKGEESDKRSTFHDQLHGHFLTTLFRGLDSIPTDFAAQDALSFDEELFEVSEEELRSLSELFPNYSHLLFPKKECEEMVCKDEPLPLSEDSKDEDKQQGHSADKQHLNSSSSHEELVKQKTEELAAQFDKNIKIEVELSFLKDTNKKLNDVNKELEDNLQSNQEQLEKKLSLICDLQRELDQVRNELDQVEKERSTFQTLASEKDTRISNLKSDNEAFKLKERGWNMEKKKLATQIEELQAQAASQSKLLTEREDSLKKIQRDIDLLNSDQTVNEQHRQQLTNLRQEIEQRKDKEKMFELEKLRLDKDKLVQEIETKAKLRHGEMERTLDQVQDLNSKLEANLVVLQNKQDSQTKEVEEERETTAMFKAEAERDIKLQKQNAAMELEELKEQAGRREAAFQERILALQTEIQNRPSGSGVNTGDTATDPAAPSPSPDQLAPSQLAVQLRDQAREIESLRTARARSLQIAVTQFQKGDTVFFYYDETKSNYLVANVSPNEYQYFLHPDNLGALGLSLDPPGRKPWAIGVIKDKEFCQARKVNNRFKVPEGRKFYRVYAQPRDSNNAPSNAPSNSARNPD
ncbi:RB1-inducible coiled-coil protein 1-like isoform X3 [Bolinopsis microptera]|uniref:RB1-inducible coiled-coil protein 1-like isoform X3 n=1 Tax=Bolinopsis microptera TaxID=2820187 RepID=UPI00307A101F